MSRVTVVTGAASGMGLAIAQRLARNGYRVALFDRDGAAAQIEAEKISAEGGQAIAATVDVSDRAAVDSALEGVRSDFGPIEVMVTSAGIDATTPFTDITPDAWERMIAVNLTGTFHCLQAVVPDMLAGNWGRIVTISSSSAQSGAARMAHYVASKGGVMGMTKALALEVGPTWHHGQHHSARIHRDADAAPSQGPRRSARHLCCHRAYPGTPRWHA